MEEAKGKLLQAKLSLCLSPNSFCVFGGPTYLQISISGLKVLISRSTQNYLSKFVSVVKTQNITVHSPSCPMEKLHFNSKSLYFKGVMTWLGADTLAFRYLTHGSEPRGRGGYMPCPLAQPPHLSPLRSSLI